MIKVLFVCLGNICRSPLAQGIFEKIVRDAGLGEKCTADSAGTSGWHRGEPPHHLSIMIAKQYGIDITRQRGRSIELTDNDQFDYIIPMDNANRENLIHEFNFSPDKVIKIREFDKKSKGADVPDPYGHPLNTFKDIYLLLEHCIRNFIKFLKKKHHF